EARCEARGRDRASRSEPARRSPQQAKVGRAETRLTAAGRPASPSLSPGTKGTDTGNRSQRSPNSAMLDPERLFAPFGGGAAKPQRKPQEKPQRKPQEKPRDRSQRTAKREGRPLKRLPRPLL